MRITQTLILIPILAQVALVLGLLIILVLARAKSMHERRQHPDDIALAEDADWNEDAVKISRNYKSQFELPVIFFVLCGFAFALRTVDIWFLCAAVVFVASRIVHTLIHIGPNKVMPRFYAFGVGVAAVTAMWVILLIRIFQSGF